MRDKSERTCGECDFKGNSDNAMKKHAISHLESAVRCEQCDKVCGNRNGLTLHMKKMHKGDEEGNAHNDSKLLQVFCFCGLTAVHTFLLIPPESLKTI